MALCWQPWPWRTWAISWVMTLDFRGREEEGSFLGWEVKRFTSWRHIVIGLTLIFLFWAVHERDRGEKWLFIAKSFPHAPATSQPQKIKEDSRHMNNQIMSSIVHVSVNSRQINIYTLYSNLHVLLPPCFRVLFLLDLLFWSRTCTDHFFFLIFFF